MPEPTRNEQVTCGTTCPTCGETAYERRDIADEVVFPGDLFVTAIPGPWYYAPCGHPKR